MTPPSIKDRDGDVVVLAAPVHDDPPTAEVLLEDAMEALDASPLAAKAWYRLGFALEATVYGTAALLAWPHHPWVALHPDTRRFLRFLAGEPGWSLPCYEAHLLMLEEEAEAEEEEDAADQMPIHKLKHYRGDLRPRPRNRPRSLGIEFDAHKAWVAALKSGKLAEWMRRDRAFVDTVLQPGRRQTLEFALSAYMRSAELGPDTTMARDFHSVVTRFKQLVFFDRSPVESNAETVDEFSRNRRLLENPTFPLDLGALARELDRQGIHPFLPKLWLLDIHLEPRAPGFTVDDWDGGPHVQPSFGHVGDVGGIGDAGEVLWEAFTSVLASFVDVHDLPQGPIPFDLDWELASTIKRAWPRVPLPSRQRADLLERPGSLGFTVMKLLLLTIGFETERNNFGDAQLALNFIWALMRRVRGPDRESFHHRPLDAVMVSLWALEEVLRMDMHLDGLDDRDLEGGAAAS